MHAVECLTRVYSAMLLVNESVLGASAIVFEVMIAEIAEIRFLSHEIGYWNWGYEHTEHSHLKIALMADFGGPFIDS